MSVMLKMSLSSIKISIIMYKYSFPDQKIKSLFYIFINKINQIAEELILIFRKKAGFMYFLYILNLPYIFYIIN